MVSPRSWWSDHWACSRSSSPRTPTRSSNKVAEPGGGLARRVGRITRRAGPACSVAPRAAPVRGGTLESRRWPRSPWRCRPRTGDRDPAQPGGGAGAPPGSPGPPAAPADATQSGRAAVAPLGAVAIEAPAIRPSPVSLLPVEIAAAVTLARCRNCARAGTRRASLRPSTSRPRCPASWSCARPCRPRSAPGRPRSRTSSRRAGRGRGRACSARRRRARGRPRSPWRRRRRSGPSPEADRA